MSKRLWMVGCSGLLLAGCFAEPPVDDPISGNQRPMAALRAPVIAPLGQEIPFDASDSVDLDNDQLVYVFQFTDGSEALPSPDPLVFHAFPKEGIYTVLVRVIDTQGAEGLAAQDVSIRPEFPEEPDFCDDYRPCVVGDECVEGVCFSNGGTLE